MSSILKALKKIDETSPEADNSHPWPHPKETRDAITRDIRKRWFLRRLTTYLLVAACLISLVAVVFLRQNERSTQQQADASRKTEAGKAGQVHRAKIERTPPPVNRSNTAPARQKIAVTRQKPAARPVSPSTKAPSQIRRTSPEMAAKSDRRPPPPSNRSKPLPKRSKKAATKVTPPSLKQSGRKLPGTAPAISSQTASRPPKDSPQYDRLQDTELTLQAIAWSPEPTERIAVINGSIVREGESVEGFTLIRIRPDDIVLKDDSKSWQLDFGLRSE